MLGETGRERAWNGKVWLRISMIAEFVKTGNDTSCSMRAEVNSSPATYKTVHYEVRTISALFFISPNDWPDRLIMYHQQTADLKQSVNASQSVSQLHLPSTKT